MFITPRSVVAPPFILKSGQLFTSVLLANRGRGISIFRLSTVFATFLHLSCLFSVSQTFAHAGVSGEFPGLSAVNDPNITVRFSNPTFDCVTADYCVDVQFQSDIADQRLFGMNVRFFYEELGLELIDFRNFIPGYAVVEPDPPTILTSPPAFGYNYFGFGEPGNGPADWVNGAIQLVDFGQPPVYLSTTEWTTIFQICFSIDDSNPDSTGYCPPIVWDLEADPANGGYLAGDDGVVITLLDEQTGNSTTADEHVEQFNWAYSGTGSAPPYGAPVELECIPISCGIDIVCPADITITCGQSTLPALTGSATSDDHCPGEPVITYSDSIINNSCGYLRTIYRRWSVSDSCANLNSCTQVISIQLEGSVCGIVLNDLDEPIPGVALQLLIDINGNGMLDTGDTLVAEVFADSVSGSYCFDDIEPCDYILTQTMPGGHLMYEDFDVSPDPDGDDSAEGPDNQIPVALAPCETDSGNVFVDFYCPAEFPEVPSDTICEGDMVSLTISDPNNGLCTYDWSFGSGSNPTGGTGLGPHHVVYSSTAENQLNGAAITITLQRPGCPDTAQEVSTIRINEFPGATINGSTTSGCYYTDRTFKPLQDEIPGASYAWNFGFGAIPQTATGYGPHIVYYDTMGLKEVKLVIHPNTPGADCPDSSMISFTITSCPASIGGTVKSTDGSAIPGVNLRLFTDADTNGIADNASVVRSVFSNSSGTYSMASLEPGHYIIQQVQPSGWMSFDDGDSTNDGDMVENMDSLDNIIPVSLYPFEIDVVNSFSELGAPGTISGAVFNDLDDDVFPDANEGIAAVTIHLFPDVDADGVADSPAPYASVVTDALGIFFFDEIPTGHYVLAEMQPSSFYSIKDIDVSNDNDLVSNGVFLNDSIPVTVMNAEIDAHNYFVETDTCLLTVMNTLDYGKGSLRLAVTCAASGDSIFFDSSLSGDTIRLLSGGINFDKHLILYSALEPKVGLTSIVPGLVSISESADVEFHNMEIISGLACGTGAAFHLEGIARLFNVIIHRHPSLPPTEFLVKIGTTGQLFISGECILYNQ